MATRHSPYTGTDFYCDIALQNTKSFDIVYEDDSFLSFHHTRPTWPVHIVVIPKKHIPSFTNRSTGDDKVIAGLLKIVEMMAKKVEDEYGAARILTNLGKYQDSKHLHFHVSSGDPLT